jgi:hypothetical protein
MREILRKGVKRYEWRKNVNERVSENYERFMNDRGR